MLYNWILFSSFLFSIYLLTYRRKGHVSIIDTSAEEKGKTLAPLPCSPMLWYCCSSISILFLCFLCTAQKFAREVTLQGTFRPSFLFLQNPYMMLMNWFYLNVAYGHSKLTNNCQSVKVKMRIQTLLWIGKTLFDYQNYPLNNNLMQLLLIWHKIFLCLCWSIQWIHIKGLVFPFCLFQTEHFHQNFFFFFL